jgi:3-hydroxyisobutyrate dehydrogenase-like beta-hydroxyacid dehydrogenase
MAKLGFLGLGIMGGPMARHLLLAGHQVALWSHSQDKASAMAKHGNGIVCATPAEVAAHSECIFLCVGDTAMSRTVITGPKGLASTAKPDTVIADCSTIAPTESQHMAAELRELGLYLLDAPCTGSKNGAESGNLTFMVGETRLSSREYAAFLSRWERSSITAAAPAWACTPSSRRT